MSYTSVYFDKSVEVSKYDRERQENDVKWLSSKQTNQLDDLDESNHKDNLSPHGVVVSISW
tara:strand:+ start:968 stop:1150 length:183 start_codon:yes stop_codon:yes gene_type:complete